MLLERPGLDPARVRADFPILAREVNGRHLVYLDSAATSQKPRAVIRALVGYYERSNASVHRGAHRLAEEATGAYEGARARVARFLGADDPRGVVFTRNATEAINLVAWSWGRANLRPDDEVVVTAMEHHSNLVPWQLVAGATGARLRVVPFLPDGGQLDLGVLRRLLGDRTRLVALTHCSNVLGTINPVAEIARAAHAVGALVLVDAAQSAPHMPLDVSALGADFLALSGHKMCGPTGIGALWGRPELLEEMPPFLTGGSMVREVRCERATWAEAPARFEAGTPNVADAVAFGAALDYLDGLGMARVRAHGVELVHYALSRLAELPWLRVYGPARAGDRGGVLAFNLFADGRHDPEGLIHPHDVGTVLDGHGIAIRAGHHCCQPLLRALGAPATARASFYVYNGTDDVDALVDALVACHGRFAR
jgi:cysteine desulfurase/selenocysteine lyase